MATGVKPRDEEHQFSRTDVEALEDAMKNKKFRDMLVDYFEEVQDPANQALYQKEMTQLEKERGYDVTFINPKGGYVIKTSVAGDRKAFINICSNDNVNKPSCSVKEIDGRKGMNWLIPYSLIPPREDYDRNKEKCVIYDVVFHPDTLRMAEVNKRFRELVNNTAFDALKTTYNIDLDCNNFRFPKSLYKGMTTHAVIRTEDPHYKPPSEEETNELSPDMIEKLYPQHIYSHPNNDTMENKTLDQAKTKPATSKIQSNKSPSNKPSDKPRIDLGKPVNGYTVPRYVIKQQKELDFQDFTFDKNSKEFSAIPSHLVININLPLLSSTQDCALDVQEKHLSLTSEKPARYKLKLNLPYAVDDQCGNAKFDKTKRILTVTLPVIRKQHTSDFANSLRTDSGVDSGECSDQSDENDNTHSENGQRITVISSNSIDAPIASPTAPEAVVHEETLFLDPSVGYLLPPYTHNVLDDVIAFTFHVKNTEPDSVVVKKIDNKVQIKFTSIGAGFVPVYYTAVIVFEENIKFEEASGEAWDNNVILQIHLAGELPQKYEIGLSEESLTCEYFDKSLINKAKKVTDKEMDRQKDTVAVEVTNSGMETNILVSSNTNDYDEDDLESPEKEIVWVEDNANNAKSILRKPIARSLSESSVGDVASSMDYISSDCIPEESSLKKTVRFSDVIARQFYRYNSSIAGQKKKNQRKKSKKRNLERRKSESEAEDEVHIIKANKPKLASAVKERRDSGLADTSDAETDCRNTPVTNDTANENNDVFDDNTKENNADNNVGSNSAYVFRDSDDVNMQPESPSIPSKPITCESIKHNTELYNPDKLNKGLYSEVKFKNDLIFDLDM